ncbi:hypothetical protein FB566_2445 [Stackebrandtia endophytica]|uniref:Uncharacterized protein n=1 Tax=Stackebrandtia endophytica TaxID=1496996 RepID=A0A543AWF1_9ACTN|nr:hypothetical protein [Stackebrandtia endophytica]TQL76901.1 hypothetical protein FB566_2445 [Stackebrandtia endophytica]
MSTPQPSVSARSRKLPIIIGAGLLGVVVVVGVLVAVGFGSSSARLVEADLDITSVDFANTPVTGPDGTEYRLIDGKALKPGMEDYNVGYHLQGGPEYADVDGDGILEAATLMVWQPAAGSNTFAVYLWRWDGKRAVHLPVQVEARYHGSLTDLSVFDGGFQMKRMTYLERSGRSITETVMFGLDGDDVVRLNPLSAVAACDHDPGGAPGVAVTPGTVPLVAPHDGASPVGIDMSTVDWMGSQEGDPDGDGWALVQMVGSPNPNSCGWVPADSLTQ